MKDYVLAISNTWPPMAAGSGRAFKELVSGVKNLVVLAPKASYTEDEPSVQRVLRFSGRVGGPFKINTILQHLEIILAPIVWSILRGLPRLVLCNMPLFSGVGGWLLNCLTKTPYIIHSHGEELTRALKSNSLFYTRYHLTLWVLRKASAIVCNSDFTQRTLCEQYGITKDKLYVIHPTVDISERKVDPYEAKVLRHKLAGDCKIVLMVGRLIQERKGFDKAIEAMPLVLKDMPDVKLVIAGPGDQSELKSHARKFGVEDDVIFTGELERKKLMTLYAVCDVFLLPTRSLPNGDTEGFGIVFLEANLMGKPVIAGQSGGATESVLDGVTGLSVDGYDVKQIAYTTVYLLRNPSYAARLGQQGKERVLKEFSSESQQKKFVNVVHSILSAQESGW